MSPRIKALLSLACLSTAALAAPESATDVRLYTMDCGTIEAKDFGLFADTGEYDGVPQRLGDSCYLIRHPKGNLLWDAGLSDQIAESKDGVEVMGGAVRLSVAKPLLSQLAAIGVKPEDVNYVAFSHFHFDHVGNANAFVKATWLLNQHEMEAISGATPPFGMDPALVSAMKTAKVESHTGDKDVFGDGSVRILAAPGHTPGHQVLAVRLPKAGLVILAGDLWHTTDNRRFKRVPAINTSRADTLASFDRIETIAKGKKARVVIQHVEADYESLPKPPAYLQ